MKSFRHAPAQARVPFYDQERRALWVGSRLVKRFKQPASTQHTILSAFQELGWPARIDDPLPRAAGQDPKLRLGEAIKRLNRHQQQRLIRFRADGTRWHRYGNSLGVGVTREQHLSDRRRPGHPHDILV